MNRAEQLARLREPRTWDVLVIGGGATGLGVALDAAVRGFSVALVEAVDFAKGTSSRATKLVHGGVRYLAQGNVGLVREALRERAVLLANAPHVAQPLPFVMPGYRWWEVPFYGAGLKLYDALAGAQRLGNTRLLSAVETRRRLPGVRPQGLVAGIEYWDAQFDDARLAVVIARTAVAHGAAIVNHCPVVELLREQGKLCGATVLDTESRVQFALRAHCVINATGVWVDAIREMDQEPGAPPHTPMVAPSQGVHLVVDRAFLPGSHALLVPNTEDGRVLFAVPWLGKTLLGTTDTLREDVAHEPRPFADEVSFILREAGRYLEHAPRREDVLSNWVGLRPLVKPNTDDIDTKTLSREHTIAVARSGLVTVTGGKWTTYRAIAEDVLERCFVRRLLPRRSNGATARLPLVGAVAKSTPLSEPPGEHLYGSEADKLLALPGADRWFWRDGHGGLSEAMVRFALRYEMARTVEDVLARRSRLLFLDAAQAERHADAVARLIEEETGRDGEVAAFKRLAHQYRQLP